MGDILILAGTGSRHVGATSRFRTSELWKALEKQGNKVDAAKFWKLKDLQRRIRGAAGRNLNHNLTTRW